MRLPDRNREHGETRQWGRSASFAAILLAPLLICTGCATYFMDQVQVPNTNQRLIVGFDSTPTQKVWVMEGDVIEEVTIVDEVD